MDKHLWLVIGLAILATTIAALARTSRRPLAARFEAVPLCSRGEIAFLRVLAQITDPAHQIAPKVRLIDIVRPSNAHGRNQVIQKHVDFLIVDRVTTQPFAVIELNDKSHATPARQHADNVKRAALEAAGLRMICVTAAARYDADTIKAMLYPATPVQPAQTPATPARIHS